MPSVKQGWRSRSAMLVGLEAVERSGPEGSQRVVSKANRPGASGVRESGQGGAAGGALAWQMDRRTCGPVRRQRLTLRRKRSNAKAAREAPCKSSGAVTGRLVATARESTRPPCSKTQRGTRYRAFTGLPARDAKAGRCQGGCAMPGRDGG